MNLYYLIAILSAFFLAIANSFTILSIQNIHWSYAFFLRTIFSALFQLTFVLYFLFSATAININLQQFAVTIGYSIFGFLGLVCLYKAVETKQSSAVFPIINANA